MCPRSSLSSNLQQTASLLSSVRTPMDPIETDAAWKIYKQLQRLLPLAVRTSDWTFKENQLQYKVPSVEFHMIYDNMMKEFETAEADMRRVLEQRPAAVRPLGRESLAEVSDFFILDNSLRETTVGVPRGHTYQEKHKIVDAIAESGLQEVILGAFGSKISVDSQVAARWTTLGQKFDHTWGFTSAYDMESYDQDALCDNFYSFQDKVKSGNVVYHQDDHDYYVPVLKPKATFSQDDLVLFRKAYQDFPPGTFHGLSPEKILKQSEHKTGRIPMGLLMMAGYGICNAIVEVDPTYGKFDAPQHDEMIDRLHFLIQWCQENLPKRKIEGESPNARIFVNFTDFANWKNSHHGGGLEKVMYMIHSLSSSAPAKRPFGYMMEDPTSWMFPDEMGKYVRMVRLMMDRVGHASGKFLVHIHMYFGLAEANVLACLANGADGVWVR